MRLTRHAKNRLRWIQRLAPALSEADLLGALATARRSGQDLKENQYLSVVIEGLRLMVVVDEAEQIVITMWREE